MNARTSRNEPSTRTRSLVGRPQARSASYAADWAVGSNPSRAPMPWHTIPRSRVAVTRGSFCRSDPAAALRGLANTGLPASVMRLVEPLERRGREEHLAAHLEQRGHRATPRLAVSRCGHGVDRLDVGGDVLARAPVAPGQRPHQPAVLVEQVDRQPVDLQLAQQRRRPCTPSRSMPGVPGRHLLVGEGVVEALHPPQVVDRGEVGRHRAADLLGRRVGRAQLGPLLLERLQPPQPDVVVGVGQRRVVEHEVAPAGVLDLLAELLVLAHAPRPGSPGRPRSRAPSCPSPPTRRAVPSGRSATPNTLRGRDRDRRQRRTGPGTTPAATAGRPQALVLMLHGGKDRGQEVVDGRSLSWRRSAAMQREVAGRPRRGRSQRLAAALHPPRLERRRRPHRRRAPRARRRPR